MARRVLESLDESQCRALLAQCSLGRVGVKLGEDLVVLPVYFAIFEGDIIFATEPGTKLSAAVVKTKFAFEVDNANPPWSVLVIGHGEEIRDRGRAEAARAYLAKDWPVHDGTHLVKIRTERVTGRRLHADESPSSRAS